MAFGDSLPLLVALVALLVGLAAGKAWERYKLRDGRWIDRRRARDSHHYVLGLNFLVSNQIDLAIEDLSQATRVDGDALEIHLILGNVHRERGQVARAIQVHQALLQHPAPTLVLAADRRTEVEAGKAEVPADRRDQQARRIVLDADDSVDPRLLPGERRGPGDELAGPADIGVGCLLVATGLSQSQGARRRQPQDLRPVLVAEPDREQGRHRRW